MNNDVQDTTAMISAKEAIHLAFPFVEDFYTGEAPRNMLLEGIEIDEKNNVWMVTVGFDLEQESVRRTPKFNHGIVGDTMRKLAETTVTNRILRVVVLDAQTGEFRRMEPV